MKNKVAVITGATGGLGREAARQLAGHGARLALVSTNPEKLQALADEIHLPEDRLLTIAGDLRQPHAAREVLDAVLNRFGRADILLHFVGGWVGGTSLVDVPAGDLSAMLDQHLWTTFHLIQVFAPHLTTNAWGRIIVISSPNVGAPPARSGPYTIGKSAQEALVLTLAEELKGTGVTANVVRVRAIDVDHARQQQPSARNASWTTPEEITAAILYLCSEEAGMLNGARLPLYGSP